MLHVKTLKVMGIPAARHACAIYLFELINSWLDDMLNSIGSLPISAKLFGLPLFRILKYFALYEVPFMEVSVFNFLVGNKLGREVLDPFSLQ